MGKYEREKERLSQTPEIEIRPLAIGDDSTAFRTLNEEWIQQLFTLEAKDREMLGDPENTILRKGGQIFMGWAVDRPEPEVVGCIAMIPMGEGEFELAKMAVVPQLRGQGIGRKLFEFAIEQAKLMGVKKLHLVSSTLLKNALHLYESVGFQHLPFERRPAAEYARGDVYMEMHLS